MSISYKDLEDAYNAAMKGPEPSYACMTIGTLRYMVSLHPEWELKDHIREILESGLPNSTVIELML